MAHRVHGPRSNARDFVIAGEAKAIQFHNLNLDCVEAAAVRGRLTKSGTKTVVPLLER